MKMNLRILSCAVAVAMLSGIVSCARLTLQDEPAATRPQTRSWEAIPISKLR